MPTTDDPGTGHTSDLWLCCQQGSSGHPCWAPAEGPWGCIAIGNTGQIAAVDAIGDLHCTSGTSAALSTKDNSVKFR